MVHVLTLQFQLQASLSSVEGLVDEGRSLAYFAFLARKLRKNGGTDLKDLCAIK